MDLRARDLMVRDFDTITPDAPLAGAIKLMNNPVKSIDRRRVFGLMVVNERDELVGMISMFDVLFHFDMMFHLGEVAGDGPAEASELEEAFLRACEKAGPMKVEDLMTRTLVKVDEEAHITDIIDILIKSRLRRIPVCRGANICGVIYISDVFYEIYKNLLG
jgi:CBS domain-containing protein